MWLPSTNEIAHVRSMTCTCSTCCCVCVVSVCRQKNRNMLQACLYLTPCELSRIGTNCVQDQCGTRWLHPACLFLVLGPNHWWCCCYCNTRQLIGVWVALKPGKGGVGPSSLQYQKSFLAFNAKSVSGQQPNPNLSVRGVDWSDCAANTTTSDTAC